MPKRLPLSIGEQFGDWIVVSEPHKKFYNCGAGAWVVIAQCKCGLRQEVQETLLRNGKTRCCKKCADLNLVKIAVQPGQKIGKWTVICELPRRNGYRIVRIICDCGNTSDIHVSNLKACKDGGCVKCLPRKIKHGMAGTAEYHAWKEMLRRCYDRFSISYHNYGARGVIVCDRWNPENGGSFENFYADVGAKPSKNHQLDKEAVRLDNKIYAPGLVKWVHRDENQKRRRTAVTVVAFNKKVPLALLAERLGVANYSLRYKILAKGMSVHEAIKSLEIPDDIFRAAVDSI